MFLQVLLQGIPLGGPDSVLMIYMAVAGLFCRAYDRITEQAVVCPAEKAGNRHVYHQYTIRTPKRDALQQYLKEHEVPSVVYYPFPLHLQKALDFMGHREGDFPVTEKVSNEVLSLPVYPELDEKDIYEASELIHKCLKG